MPIMMKNGKFLMLNDDYELDFKKSIENTIRNGLLLYPSSFNFNYYNTIGLIESITNKVLETIEFYNEQEKIQNQSSTTQEEKD